MAGRDRACRSRLRCRTVLPDERNTPPAGDCGRYRAGASPASTRPCPRAHHRSLRLRNSSPIGRPPAPNPPGRAAHRSGTAAPEPPPLFRGGRLLLVVAASSRCSALLFALITWQVVADGPLLGPTSGSAWRWRGAAPPGSPSSSPTSATCTVARAGPGRARSVAWRWRRRRPAAPALSAVAGHGRRPGAGRAAQAAGPTARAP